MLVKTSLVREPGTGEAASGACLENRLQPGRKTPPFWCLSSALYWQGLTSCWLRKENCLKGSDPFSQRRQKVHLELGSNKSTISTIPNYAHPTLYGDYKYMSFAVYIWVLPGRETYFRCPLPTWSCDVLGPIVLEWK